MFFLLQFFKTSSIILTKDGENVRKRLQNKYFIISLYTVLTVAVSAVIIYCIFNFPYIATLIAKFIAVINPIFIGFAIAYLVNPIVSFFENKVFTFKKAKKNRERLKRLLSILCAYVLVLALLSALLAVIIPQLYSSFETFVNNIDTYQKALEKWSDSLLDKESKYYPIIERVLSAFDEFLDKAVKYVTELLPKAFLLIKNVSVLVVNLIISIFISIYMISKKEFLLAQIKKLVCAFFNSKWISHIYDFCNMLDDSVGGFIRGKIIDSAIIGVLCYIVMLILRLDYAILISTIVGITNVIPFFGPFIGAIPSAFILLMVNPGEVIPFLIAILLIQQLDGNYIGPKILGNSMGLSAFWVLVAIVVMSGLFGFMGLIIGVPIFSVAYVLVERIVNQRLSEKNFPTETELYYKGVPEPVAEEEKTQE